MMINVQCNTYSYNVKAFSKGPSIESYARLFSDIAGDGIARTLLKGDPASSTGPSLR